MKRVDLSKIDGVHCGKNSFIECDEFMHYGKFFIGDNVTISSKKVYLGNNARIEDGTKIHAINGKMDFFIMGDESVIGFNSQVMVPQFVMGDYTKIFNSSLCSGYKPLTLGHNCWVGQSSILNSAETLTIGNNVRMGSVQIWTHVASGELLEGCKFYSEKPVVIEDNVWLMGFGHTVSPGVTIRRNTIVMSGSVVSKSTEAFHTYSGVPARDVTENLNGWNKPTLEEKFYMLKGFVQEFLKDHPEYINRVQCFEGQGTDDLKVALKSDKPTLIFFKEIENMEILAESLHSVFDLKTKKYVKRRTDIEVDWMKFSISYRARFIPITEDVKV